MKFIRKALDRAKPAFSDGGKLSALGSVFEGVESFLYTPRQTSAHTFATHIHDSVDSKRTMIIVVLALMPCFFFGMYNTGYQHWLAAGEHVFPFWCLILYGFFTRSEAYDRRIN